jgi:predicted AAA+ superfamily ATPase
MLIERHIRSHVTEALSYARAVCLLGPRQVGKSTLAVQIAKHDHPARYLTLDEEGIRHAALDDPVGFVAAISGPVVIDEIQRAPDLMLAIKARLDTCNDRGQFLLTGSANVITLPTIADNLPGRVDYIYMWPFSQGELVGARERFVDRLFANDPPRIEKAEVGRAAYAERLIRGGFPDAQTRSSNARARFFASYLPSILGRDVSDIARIHDVAELGRLFNVVAARSGSLMSARGMSGDLGIDHKTVSAYMNILENLFLVRRLNAWHANIGSRQVKAPKLHVSDAGLLARVLHVDTDRLAQDATLAGTIFETFAVMEIARQCSWSEQEPSLWHYRDHDRREVDLVLELGNGEIAAVEVKSSATVRPKDFGALRFLRDALGPRFKAGVVLYTGAHTLPFGERLTAVPLSGLWSG